MKSTSYDGSDDWVIDMHTLHVVLAPGRLGEGQGNNDGAVGAGDVDVLRVDAQDLGGPEEAGEAEEKQRSQVVAVRLDGCAGHCHQHMLREWLGPNCHMAAAPIVEELLGRGQATPASRVKTLKPADEVTRVGQGLPLLPAGIDVLADVVVEQREGAGKVQRHGFEVGEEAAQSILVAVSSTGGDTDISQVRPAFPSWWLTGTWRHRGRRRAGATHGL